jgi:hypothetical protein
MAPPKQRIMITSQMQLIITTKRQFFVKANSIKYLYDTLTNLHVKRQMPQAQAQV